MKNLGVTLGSKLNFALHMEGIVHKALKNVGFIFWNTKIFHNFQSYKTNIQVELRVFSISSVIN